MAKDISSPINFEHPRIVEFFDYLMRITAGNYGLTIPVTSRRDELDAIAHAINVVVGELNEENQAAAAAVAQKSRFMASISHEIRTPITAILGFSKLLNEAGISAKDREQSVARIQRSCSYLLDLIESLMDLSKVESGSLVSNLEFVNLREEFEPILDFCKLKTHEKGLTFRFHLDPEMEKWVELDKTKFRQVVLNLANNAIKYTAKGEVGIGCHKAPVGLLSNALAIEVRDSGAGISKDLSDTVFEPFRNFSNEIHSEGGGVGLGLSIAKAISRFLGGDVLLKNSEVGLGSTFMFYLPVRWKKENPRSTQRAGRFTERGPTLKGIQILIVEDNVDLSELFLLSFGKTAAKVVMAADGQAAIVEMNRGKFDIVLMDVEMPRMDGLSALRAMRSSGASMPVVMLTAHTASETHKECMRAGASAVLTKPIVGDQLIEYVQEFFANRSPKAP